MKNYFLVFNYLLESNIVASLIVKVNVFFIFTLIVNIQKYKYIQIKIGFHLKSSSLLQEKQTFLEINNQSQYLHYHDYLKDKNNMK